jgi:hypothetical protein
VASLVLTLNILERFNYWPLVLSLSVMVGWGGCSSVYQVGVNAMPERLLPGRSLGKTLKCLEIADFIMGLMKLRTVFGVLSESTQGSYGEKVLVVKLEQNILL